MTLKTRLAEGQITIGSWITIGHPAIPEVMATAGFDWLAIDLEHSVITLRDAQELIRAIEGAGCVPLVRLTSNDGDLAKRVLDAGAQGLIVPMIKSATEAAEAVRHAHYPPVGTRSVGLARAQRYGDAFESYVATAASSILVVVQIEHRDAIRELPDILGRPGIDATLIGPYDLSASLGRPGDFADPDVVKALRDYETESRAAGVPMGYHVVDNDPEAVAVKVRGGYRFVAYSADFLFLKGIAREGMQHVRRLVDSLQPVVTP